MAKLMTSRSIMEEGMFLNKWFQARINNNKNVLIAFTGSTGSGKTYSCLSVGEGWYRYNFKEEFPEQNVCFGLSILAKRINELHKANKLRKGEMFILEEAGANMGNLDFQNKLQKMFSYILQSFRSMNLVILMNLPVLTMLNKTARQLIHAHFITCGIDYEHKLTKVKPYMHQLNQQSGKSYWKYPRARINGRIITLQRLKFKKPSDRLLKSYELDKAKFVFNLTEEFVEEAEKNDKQALLKASRDGLTEIQRLVMEQLCKGSNIKDIALLRGVTERTIYDIVKAINKKGYEIKNNKQSPKIDILSVQT